MFSAPPGWDGFPYVLLQLGKVNVARLQELVTDAWPMRAPDGLLDTD